MSTPDFPHSLSDDSPEAEFSVDFFAEDVDFEILNSNLVREWLANVILQEKKHLERLSFIFCSDEFLYQMNVDYLQHDTYTDVITFPYGGGDTVEGDIFISIDRVKENAVLFQSTFERELYRVMVHGVLHLCGYGDKTEEEEAEMRNKENTYIRYWDESN